MGDKAQVGIIGCGNIAPAYIKGSRQFSILEVVACADLDPQRAQALAEEYDLRALTVDALLCDPEIEIILNLTVPKVHAQVSLAIIAAGKHVHSEKPLAITRTDGQKILSSAQQAGVLVGCAPDTFLGGGLQTCRKLIDDGAIGQPVAAVAFMASRGPEAWHPNPFFFYETGGGPLFDMGPYYLTALVHLLGPVRQVAAITRRSFPERIAGHENWRGQKIPVQVATHITGALDFASGAVGTIMMSFDVWRHHLPRIEIYGSEGSLSVPDPNTFRGPVSLWRAATGEWEEAPLTHSADVGRGIGVADLAYAAHNGRKPRASGDLAYHVLEVMAAFDQASDSRAQVAITSQPGQPSPLPLDLPVGELDE